MNSVVVSVVCFITVHILVWSWQVLEKDGFANARELIAAAGSEHVKQQLRRNTDAALRRGLFGVPAFECNGVLLWGQDRLNVLADLLCGWRPSDMLLQYNARLLPTDPPQTDTQTGSTTQPPARL